MTVEVFHGVDVAANPGTVYEAITTEKGERGFWTADSRIEERVGSVAEFRFPGAPAVCKMRVDELDPERKVVWASLGDFPLWAGTTVTWELAHTPDDAPMKGTRVLFRHAGFSDEYAGWMYASVNYTWGQVLARLRGYAETGEPQPYFP